MAPSRLAGKYGPVDAGMFFNITASDSADLPYETRWLIVGGAGNVQVTDPDGNTATFALPVGVFPVRIQRLWSTSTTATGIVGIR